MNKLGAVGQSFAGNKISGYDVKRMQKIAINLAAGDVKSAKQNAIEYMEDKESDTFRHIVITLLATGAAVAAGRKLGKPIVKNLSVAGDVVCDWIRKNANDGKKVVTEMLDKTIGEKQIRKVLGKFIPNKDYLNKATAKGAEKLKDLKIENVRNVAEIGVGALATYVIGGATNKFTDIIDDKTDEKRQADINESCDINVECEDCVKE